MAEQMVPMSVEQLGRTVGGAVRRERSRCVRVLVTAAAAAEEANRHERAALLREAADLIAEGSPVTFAGPTYQKDTSPTPGAVADAAEPEEEELPPVRHIDDDEEAVIIARQRLARRS
jgi:hypothetical protein